MTEETLIEIFNIQKANIEYLRQEHSSLVVAGQFGTRTSQLFRNLSRGTTNLDDRHLDILTKAVQISGSDNTQRYTSSRGGDRGRGFSNAYPRARGSYHGSGYWRGGRGGGSGTHCGSGDSGGQLEPPTEGTGI